MPSRVGAGDGVGATLVGALVAVGTGDGATAAVVGAGVGAGTAVAGGGGAGRQPAQSSARPRVSIFRILFGTPRIRRALAAGRFTQPLPLDIAPNETGKRNRAKNEH